VAVYTDITDAELSDFLADFDLGRLRACKGIAEGVENSNFLVDTDRGRYILTIYERRVNAAELPFFLGLMRHLAGNGFPSPVPQADRQGVMLKTLRGKPAAMVSFLPGFSVREPGVSHCREAGAGLAQLHAAASGFSLNRKNSLGEDAWASMFAPHRADAEALAPGLGDLIAADLATIHALWPKGLPSGVIHADLFPDNVFFIEQAFVAAIDFYFACNDALAYDLAVCLNSWCCREDGSVDPDRARAMIEGYESRRRLSDAEVAAIPVLSRGAAMRFFLTRLIDWGSTPAGALVRPKDPMEYARKLAFHRKAEGDVGAYGFAPGRI
jgi:homoserine kinase type II